MAKEPRQILAKFGMGMSHGAYVKEKKHLVETARQLCRYVQFLLFSFVYCIRVGPQRPTELPEAMKLKF